MIQINHKVKIGHYFYTDLSQVLLTLLIATLVTNTQCRVLPSFDLLLNSNWGWPRYVDVAIEYVVSKILNPTNLQRSVQDLFFSCKILTRVISCHGLLEITYFWVSLLEVIDSHHFKGPDVILVNIIYFPPKMCCGIR